MFLEHQGQPQAGLQEGAPGKPGMVGTWRGLRHASSGRWGGRCCTVMAKGTACTSILHGSTHSYAHACPCTRVSSHIGLTDRRWARPH